VIARSSFALARRGSTAVALPTDRVRKLTLSSSCASAAPYNEACAYSNRSSRPMHKIEIAQQAIDISMRRRGRVQPFVVIEPRKTALLVVDMQAEIPAAREIVPNINRLAGALRRAGGTVVWIVSTYGPGAEQDWTTFFNFIMTGETADRFRLAFQEGRPEHTLWRELDRHAEDAVVSKNRLTPFVDPSRKLETMLRSRGIEMTLIVGTVTNVCCECTARDAAMRNFKTIMISDANASRNDVEQNATLSIFLQAFGGVVPTDEAIAMIQKGSES
jgi:ureidoacrylate peracid hydrolase